VKDEMKNEGGREACSSADALGNEVKIRAMEARLEKGDRN